MHRMVCRQCRAAEKDCQWIWPGRSKKTRSCQSCSHFKARCELEGEEKKEADICLFYLAMARIASRICSPCGDEPMRASRAVR